MYMYSRKQNCLYCDFCGCSYHSVYEPSISSKFKKMKNTDRRSLLLNTAFTIVYLNTNNVSSNGVV